MAAPYRNEAEARSAVVDAATSQVGASDASVYWSVARYSPPWSLDWSGPFALWCLWKAHLTDWHWREGSGFLHRLPLVRRNVLSVAAPGDMTYLPAPLDRHAVIASVESDHVVLISGAGRRGRVTKTAASRAWVRNLYPIRRLVDHATS
jgi:hypothetical protein